MTRCTEFYEKVEKDGNFCGMKDQAYQDLMKYRALVKTNPEISGLTENACQKLLSEPDKDVKAKAIEVIAKQLKDGGKVTAKVVKEDLKKAGHKDKEKKERLPTEEDKQHLTEDFVNQMAVWGCDDSEITRRVQKAIIFTRGG